MYFSRLLFSTQQIPDYIAKQDALRAKGVRDQRHTLMKFSYVLNISINTHDFINIHFLSRVVVNAPTPTSGTRSDHTCRE